MEAAEEDARQEAAEEAAEYPDEVEAVRDGGADGSVVVFPSAAAASTSWSWAVASAGSSWAADSRKRASMTSA